MDDVSEFFQKKNIIAKQKNYKVDKETMLSLKDKNISGGGSVVWNEYKDNSYFDPQYLMTGETKLEYIHDPVYMSMKEPSEAISEYMSTRTNGALLYYQPEGYTNLIGIGALYAAEPDNLPEEFIVCLGALKTYTLSDEPNAKWILHEEHKYPLGLTVYELPWTTHVSYALDEGQIEYCENHVKLHLKKKDLTNSVLHFWGSSKRIIDLKHTIGIVVMYEVWTETENLTGGVFAATGADQRIVFNSGSNNVKQAMSGKNWLVKLEHRLVISHNIPDKIYDELKYTANDPEKLVNAFYEIEKYVEPIEEKPFYYTLPKKCIIGYSEETDDYLKICSIAYNSDSNNKFVNMGFDIEKTSASDLSKLKKDVNVLISTKDDTATCNVYANNYNGIVVCNDSENKVVNIYIKVHQYAYINLVLRNVIGYTSLVTFEETFVNLFDRTKFANFKEENTTKELQGTPISVIDTELKLPVNDGNIIKNLSPVIALNILKNNPKEGVYYYYLNGWDSVYKQEPYNILPPSNVSGFYFVESRFRYFDNDKTMLYGEQTWHNLASGITYTKTMVNNVWKPFKEQIDIDIVNNIISEQYVTPEMFGAVGDGVTDDTEAFTQACSKNNVLISKKYKITQPITLYKTVITANNNNAELICAVDDDFAIILNGYSELRNLKISGKKCVKITSHRNKILHCNFIGDETINDDVAITFNYSNWFGENYILNNYFNKFYKGIDCDNSEASITDNHINDNVFIYGTNSIVGTLAGCFICNNHDYSNEGMYLTVANCLIDGNYFDNKDHISLNIAIRNGSTSIKDNLFYSATENDTTCILIRDFNNARCICTGNRTGGHKGTVTLFDLNNKWIKGDFRGNVCANLYKNVIWSSAQSSVGITMEGLFYFNNEEYTLPISIVGNVVSVRINSTGTFDVGKIGRLEWTYISAHDIYTPFEYENGIGTAIFRANGDVEIYNSNGDSQMKNIKIAVDIPMRHTEISY